MARDPHALPPGTNVFVWSSRYETGITVVDVQHQGLVDLINRVGRALETGADAIEIQVVLEELVAYARDHFATEARLMRESGVDLGFAEQHIAGHGRFVKQLALLRDIAREAPQRFLPALHDYLINWLAQHILVDDQAMARAVQGLADDAAAHAETNGEFDLGHEALVDAMHHMYEVLAARNAELSARNAELQERKRQLNEARRQLAEFNAGLGEQLATRTAQVYQAQHQLQQHQDVRDALERQLRQVQHAAKRRLRLPDALLRQCESALDHFSNLLAAMPSPSKELEDAGGELAHLVRTLVSLCESAQSDAPPQP